MASITLNIGEPALAAGEKFRISYYEAPSGAVVNLPDAVNNNPIVVNGLNAGSTYVFTINYVKSDNTVCGDRIVIIEIPEVISPPPPPPPPPPVDPPPPPPPRCNCLTITYAKVHKECDGRKYIRVDVDTATTGDACMFMIEYKTGAGSWQSTTFSTFTSKQIAVTETTNVFIKVWMKCCSNGQWIKCYESLTELDLVDCVCTNAPSLNPSYTTAINGSNTDISFSFSASVPHIAPYLVEYIVAGNIVASQSVGVAGNHTLSVPTSVMASGILKVSNYCGADQISITIAECTGAPIVTSIIRDYDNFEITVNWTGSNVSAYNITLDGYTLPSQTAVVSSTTNSHTFSVTTASWYKNLLTATVSDDCGTGYMQSYP